MPSPISSPKDTAAQHTSSDLAVMPASKAASSYEAVSNLCETRELTEFDDVRILLRKWRAAKKLDALPLYEDLVLGGLGKFADEVGIVRCMNGADYTIVRAGSRFEDIVQSKCNSVSLHDLPHSFQLSIGMVLDGARVLSGPCLRLCQSTLDGMISTVELVALPLASRWSGEFFLIFARSRAQQTDLANLLINSIQEGIMALTALEQDGDEPQDFLILSINEGAARLLGSTAENLRSMRLSMALENAGVHRGVETLREAVKSEDRRSFTFEYCVDGQAASLQAGISMAGELLTVTLTDVGALKARETLFRSMFDDNPVPMVVRACHDRQALRVNDAALRLYGYERKEFLKLKLSDFRLAKQDARIMAHPNGRDSGTSWRHQTATGNVLDVVVFEREITVEGKPAILATIVDVTERTRAEAQISYLAHHDPLTGLSNRTVFTRALERAVESQQHADSPFAVISIDLDGFKLINDTLGHDAGDDLLKGVATRLRDLKRASDTVARLGGDEFAFIMQGCSNRDDVALHADQIIAALNQPHWINNREVRIGTSVGIAFAPADAQELQQILKFADLALYRAKKDAGNAYRFFEPEMDRVESERRSLEMDLRRAVIENEFVLCYQPIIGVKTGQLRGFEALIRWSHPTRGMVSPADFIPLAEEIGLIEELGEWVMIEACREAVKWPEPLIVAVNVSAVQFSGGRLVSGVERALRQSGLCASRLEIEITESVLLNDTEDNIEILQQLHQLDTRIALDDFGTGYSSMAYLTKFPFSRIKIDRSFVRDIQDSVGSRAVVRAIIGLGSCLGMDITAEGVETVDQLEVLRTEKCSELQGFLFSPPIPRQNLQTIINAYFSDGEEMVAAENVA